ncbi:MAG TPA: hypothetical protein VFF06_07085 [Polyangia bacterium]|nr:hypothetical protein [Polyangia bacterium]
MSRLASLVILCGAFAGCGSGDFEVPPQPDARMELDLAANTTFPPTDMTCFNTACGGCSSLANWDGTPVKVGDPCLWNGAWQCSGAQLACSSAACLSCPQTVSGTVCGADGHTILELVHNGATCTAYDLGSAISTCNHGASDACVGRCTQNGGSYDCVAHCASDDGGGTGHVYSAADTCVTLSM